MSTYEHGVTAVILGAPEITLRLKSATITLDEDWTPFVQGSLVIPRPDAATAARLDPRTNVVVRVTLTGVGGPSSHSLGLRSTSLDRLEDTLTLELASDEARLMDYALVAAATDTSRHAMQGSLKAIINSMLALIPYPVTPGGVSTIPTGAPDRAFNTDLTNLIANSRAGTDLTNITSFATGSATTLTRLTGQASYAGGTAARVSNTNATTYIDCRFGTNLAGIDVEEGRIYTGSAKTASSQTGTVRAYIQWYNEAGVAVGSTVQGEIINGGGSPVEPSVTGEAPLGATRAVLVIRNLAQSFPNNSSTTTGNAILVESGAPAPYFDGSSTDTSVYRYDWTGTALASASTRTALVDGIDQSLLDWEPGQSAWDFLVPLLDEAGLRLYSSNPFVWTLEAPQTTNGAVVVGVITGVNTSAGTETLSRDGDWYDSVVLVWNWTDAAGNARRRSATAGVAGGRTLLLEYAYPGPSPATGAARAAAILTRTRRRGIVNSFELLADYSVRPGITIVGDTTGACSAVTFRAPASTMQLTTRLNN